MKLTLKYFQTRILPLLKAQAKDAKDLKKKAMASLDGVELVDEAGAPVDIQVIDLSSGGAEPEAPAVDDLQVLSFDDEEEEDKEEKALESVITKAINRAFEKRGLGTVKQPSPQRRSSTVEVKGYKIPATAMAHRVKSFTIGDRDERTARCYAFGKFMHAVITGSEDSVGWCKSHGIDIVRTKAQAGNINTAGGALIPEEFVPDLIRLVEEYGVFRQNSYVHPMGRDTAVVPRRTSGLTAYFTGENSSITESEVAFADVQLIAKKLATLTRLSNEVIDDSAISLGDLVAEEIAYAYSEKEDDCGFNGDGTSTYGGIVGVLPFAGTASVHTAVTGNTSFAELDLVDFHNVVGKLPKYAEKNAKWYISKPGFAASMQRLAHAQGGVTRRETEEGSQLEFLGYPVEITQKLNSTLTAQTSTNIMCFGDLRMGTTFGDRRDMTVATSTDRYFEQDQTAIRGTERFDVTCHTFDDTSTAGPIIVLATPGS